MIAMCELRAYWHRCGLYHARYAITSRQRKFELKNKQSSSIVSLKYNLVLYIFMYISSPQNKSIYASELYDYVPRLHMLVKIHADCLHAPIEKLGRGRLKRRRDGGKMLCFHCDQMAGALASAPQPVSTLH